MADVVMLLAVVSLTACAAESQPQPPSLVGAWRIVEVTTPDGQVNGAPQPSLYIFTPRHYSMLRLNGTEPRPLMSDTATRYTITDAEMRTIVNPFIGNAGTYEVQGPILIASPIVSFWPNFMSGGADTTEMVLTGDTLRLTQRSGSAASTRWSLVRQQ